MHISTASQMETILRKESLEIIAYIWKNIFPNWGKHKCYKKTAPFKDIHTENNRKTLSIYESQDISLSWGKTKPTKWLVHPVKTQISLGIHPDWSVFAVHLKKLWVLSYPYSAQWRLIGWMDALSDPSLRWAHTGHFIGSDMLQLGLLFYKNSSAILQHMNVEKCTFVTYKKPNVNVMI